MAKGSRDQNQKQAIKLQNQSLARSRKDGLRIEESLKAMAKANERMVQPKFEGSAAQPTVTMADMEASMYERRNARRRKQGLNDTTYAGAGARPANVRMGAFGGGQLPKALSAMVRAA